MRISPPAALGGLPTDQAGMLQRMRLMFGIWVVLLVAGVVFFSIVGLSHR